MDYNKEEGTEQDDLTALCENCHVLATTMRRFCKYGGNVRELISKLNEYDLNMDYKPHIA